MWKYFSLDLGKSRDVAKKSFKYEKKLLRKLLRDVWVVAFKPSPPLVVK